MSTIKYTINDIKEIKNNGFDYKLPDNTLKMINELAKLVGAPEYIKTPIFSKKKKRTQVTDEDWENIKNYKVTPQVKFNNKEQLIQDVKSCFYKITNVNYEEQKEKIIDLLKKVEENDFNNMIDIIYDIICSNKFYSNIYAKIYKELLKLNEKFKIKLDDILDSYLNQFDNISYVDPNEDYSLFCENNIKNEKLLALSLFIVKIVDKKIVIDKIENLINRTICVFNEEDKIYLAIEYSENLCVLISEYFKLYKKIDEVVKHQIEQITLFKLKQYPSLNNKIQFKFMDLYDILE